MSKRILIQLDSDSQPSTFDSVVAIDSNVDHLLRHHNVQVTTVTPLVHGAMFTRGGDDLKNTAIFVGGSDVSDAEAIFAAAQEAFFGPVRVSLMLDANGCNTTSAAAVVAASRHTNLSESKAVVLGGTGPVGRRVTQLLVSDGASVTVTSRSLARAQDVCEDVGERIDGAKLTPDSPATPDQIRATLGDADIVIACGAAGIELVAEELITDLESLKVAIDLNAVPPAGIGGVGVMDKAKPLGHGVGYGAIGVGGLKMKTHRRAIEMLFESNDRLLDAAEIYAIAKSMDQ